MDSNFPAAPNHLLLLQHRPTIAPVVWQASLNLNCHLDVANDPGQFFHHYDESLLNPFRMFGYSPIHGILLDLVHATHKTLDVLSELRARFSDLPPVIGLCRSLRGKQADYFLGEGFDELIDFPGKDDSFQFQLNCFLEKTKNSKGSYKASPQKEQLDNLPLVNLKTYGLFREFAVLQGFPLDQLFNSFFEEMEGFIHDLIRQFEAGNYKGCERLCTSIRSLGGTLGASQLAQTSRHMEFSLKTGKPEELGHWIPYIIEEFMVLRDYFELQPATLEEVSQLS